MEKKLLINLFKLSHVPRWSVCDMIKPQTVSDHSFRVEVIAVYLIDKLKLPLNKGDVVLSIMFHDSSEGETGDLPSNFKSANQILEPSGSPEKALLRLSDSIEAAIQLARYGKNPTRVMRFLERKLQFTQNEISTYFDIPVLAVAEVVDNLIMVGKNYD